MRPKTSTQRLNVAEAQGGEIVRVPIVDGEELAGVTLVQSLQKMNGIEESFETALAGWRKMTPAQREQTKQAYHFFRETRN